MGWTDLDSFGSEIETPNLDQFDNSLGNIGNSGSNYAYGIGFSSASSGPLDKFKMTVGQGGIRSPLLVSGPGIEGGRKSDAFVYVTDIMPTLLELANVEYPAKYNNRNVEPMRGRSMRGVLNNNKKAVYDDSEFIGGELGGGMWIRQGDYKASMIPEPYGTNEWKLFNVNKDPGESKDLSRKMPDKLNALKAAWDRYAKDVGVILPN